MSRVPLIWFCVLLGINLGLMAGVGVLHFHGRVESHLLLCSSTEGLTFVQVVSMLVFVVAKRGFFKDF